MVFSSVSVHAADELPAAVGPVEGEVEDPTRVPLEVADGSAAAGLDPPQLSLREQVAQRTRHGLGLIHGTLLTLGAFGADHRADTRRAPPRPGLDPVGEHRPDLPESAV